MAVALFNVFFFVFLGYLAKQLKILRQEQGQTFITFVMYFGLPALFFERIYHLEGGIGPLLPLVFVSFVGTFLGVVFMIVMGKLLRVTRATLITMVLMGSFGNTIFLGLPIIEGVLGKEFVIQGIFYDLLATAIPLSILGPFLVSLAHHQEFSLLGTLKNIFKFPPFIGLVLGFAFQGIPLPELLFGALRTLASSIMPVALFAVGLQMAFLTMRTEWKNTLIILGGKMIIAPLMVFAIFKITHTPISPLACVVILQTSMPPVVSASALVMKAQLNTALAISTLGVGILLSFLSTPVLAWILNLQP